MMFRDLFTWLAAPCLLCLVACDSSSSTIGDDGGVGADATADVQAEGAVADATADAPPEADAGTPARKWSRGFGSANDEQGLAVAVGDSGNIYVTGAFASDLDLGQGAHTSAGSSDVFVASFAATGELRWSTRVGGPGTDQGNAIAVAADSVYVTGQFRDTVDFGDGPVESAGDSDVFVSSYAADTGDRRWSRQFGGTTNDYGNGVSVDRAGNVLVVGEFYKTMTVGSDTLVSQGGIDVFVASFSADGTPRWARSYGGDDDARGFAVVTDENDHIYVTGYYFGEPSFGGDQQPNRGGADLFLASYDSAGVHRWSTSFGNVQNDRGVALAADGRGNIYLTGRIIGRVDFGGGDVGGHGAFDAFVASFSSDGAHNWSRGFGDKENDFGMALATDRSGNVYLAGGFSGTVDFGDGARTSAGQGDIFVASYAGDGSPRWSRRFGGAKEDIAKGIAVSPQGNVCLTGYYQGTADLGDGSQPAFGGKDLFLIQLEP